MNKNLKKLLVFATITAILSILIYIFQSTLDSSLSDSGFIVTGNEITSAVHSITDESKAVSLFPVSYGQKLYRRAGSLLVGDQLTKINTGFPMFVDDGSKIMLFGDSGALITTEFDKLEGYQNLYLSGGVSFHADGLRADPDTILFLALKNGLFVNSLGMELDTMSGGLAIPENSIVSFGEKQLAYGVFDGGNILFSKVNISTHSTVTIDGEEYDYLELLEKLGLYSEKTATELTESEESALPEEEELPLVEYPDDAAVEAAQPAAPASPAAPATPASKPSSPSTAGGNQGSGLSGGSDGSSGSSGGRGDSSSSGGGSAPQKPVKPPKYVVPTVTCSELTPWVYYLSGKVTISDPESRIYKGVRFNIYKDGAMYMRLTFSAGGNITLGTLPPNTTFEVEGTFQYTNVLGMRQDVVFMPKQEYKTLPIEGNIDATALGYDRSATPNLYPTQMEVRGITFGIDPEDEVKNNALPYIFRTELSIVQKSDSSKTWGMQLSSSELKELKDAKEVNWLSLATLNSNQEYDFALAIFDRFNNRLPIADAEATKGTGKTCKQYPKANITMDFNKTANLQLTVSVENIDRATIGNSGKAFLVLKDGTGNLFQMSGSYAGGGAFDMQRVPIDSSSGSVTVNIHNLPNAVSYTAEVWADVDIENGKGMVPDVMIGKLPIVTVPISELGLVNFALEIPSDTITDSSVDIWARLTANLNPNLLPFLDRFELNLTVGNAPVMNYPLRRTELEQIKVDRVVTNPAGYKEIVLQQADPVRKLPCITLRIQDTMFNEVDNAWDAITLASHADVTKRQAGASIIISYPRRAGTPPLRYLTPATAYTITVKTIATQGGKENDVTSPAARTTLRTYKEEPTVTCVDRFVTQSNAEFYNLLVTDKNGAIIGTTVSARLYKVVTDPVSGESKRTLIMTRAVDVNKTLSVLKLDNLDPNQDYVLGFVADAFNNGFDNATYRINYTLQDEFFFSTSNAVQGSIELDSLNYLYASENGVELFDSTKITRLAYLVASGAETATTSASYFISDYISVDPTKTYLKNMGYNSSTEYTRVAFYNASYQLLGTKSCYGYVTPADFPVGTSYVRLNGYGLSASMLASYTFREFDTSRLSNNRFITAGSTLDARFNGTTATVPTASNGYSTTNFIPVTAGAEYLIDNNGDATYVIFFDADKRMIAYQRSGMQADTTKPAPNILRAPEQAAYIRIEYLTRMGSSGVFQQYGSTPDDGAYSAQMSLHITDDRDELANVRYELRGYKRSIYGGDYESIGIFDTGIFTPDANGVTADVSKNLIRSVDSGSAYRFELVLVMSSGREIELDVLTFTTEAPITVIRNDYDMYKLMFNTYGRFIVTADIYNLGTTIMGENLPFMGSLDFQGHTLTASSRDGNKALTNYLLFTVLGRTGVVENLVLNWDTDFNASGTKLMYQSYGTIRNLYVDYNVTHNIGPNTGASTYYNLIYYNYAGASIENFVISLKKDFASFTYGSLITHSNRGVIRNGYIATNDPSDPNAPAITASRDYNYAGRSNIGGIAGVNYQSGVIENVYVLSDMKLYRENTADDADLANTANTGLIVGNNGGTLHGAFSVGTRQVFDPAVGTAPPVLNQAASEKIGPAIGTVNGKMDAKNVFYAYNTGSFNYQGGYQQSVGNAALWDPIWYNTVINSQDQFMVEESLKMGYYPRVKLPDYMMSKQQFIKLPSLAPPQAPKFISAIVTKQTEDYALVDLTFENPQLLAIKGAQIHGLSCRVLSQELEVDNVYRVKVRLESPTLYLSQYELKSITYMAGSTSYEPEYGINGTQKYYVGAEFFKPLYSVNDWRNINTDLTQNYRLKADLDFSSVGYDYMNIGAASLALSGKLDGGIYDEEGDFTGEMHTISGMTTFAQKYIVYNLAGTISNMRITNFSNTKNPQNNAEVSTTYTGFVYQTTPGGNLINVHLDGATVSGRGGVGGLVGYANGAYIANCSVQNTKLSSFTAGTAALRMGGIVGSAANTNINNCYTYQVTIDALDLFRSEGVGGIVGYASYTSVTDSYTHGKITNNSMITGGVVGTSINMADVTGCISYAEVIGVGSYVGGIVGNADYFVRSNLAVGGVYTRGSAAQYFNRIVGSNVLSSTGYYPDAFRMNYSYSGQLVNGLVSTDLSDAVQLMSYAELTAPSGYTGVMGFNANYDYSEIGEGMLPKLKATTGSLIPFQPDLLLPPEGKPPILIEGTSESNGIYTIQFIVYHDAGDSVKSVEIEGMNITSSTPSHPADGTRYIVTATVAVPMDGYMLSVVLHKADGKEETILVRLTFANTVFKNIATAQEWQDFFGNGPGQSNMKNAYANVNIIGDIDFTGVPSPVVNVKVNRLTGNKWGAPGEHWKIKNINYTSADPTVSLINYVTTICADIDFEDITFTYTGAGAGDTIGLIGYNNSRVENVGFYRVNLYVRAGSSVGMIGRSLGSIEKVSLSDVLVAGTAARAGVSGSYIGGLVGQLSSAATDVTADNVEVIGASSYVGGLVGLGSATGTTIQNAKANNMKVSGTTYVGGLSGYQYAIYDCAVKGSTISGGNGVGGLAGATTSTSATTTSIEVRNSTVENTVVTGTTSVGGAIGDAGRTWDVTVLNPTVTGTTRVGGVFGIVNSVSNRNNVRGGSVSGTTDVGGIAGMLGSSYMTLLDSSAVSVSVAGSQNVGGAIGNSGGRILRGIGAIGSNVAGDSTSQNVGGLVGLYDGSVSSYGNFVLDSQVTGQSNVGGLVGKQSGGSLYRSYAQAHVTANGANAGGLVGYTTSAANATITKLYLSYFSGSVAAPHYAGGVIGLFETGTGTPTMPAPAQLLPANFYSLLVMGNVTTSVGIDYSTWANRSGGAPAGWIDRFAVYSGAYLGDQANPRKITDIPFGDPESHKVLPPDSGIDVVTLPKKLSSMELSDVNTYVGATGQMNFTTSLGGGGWDFGGLRSGLRSESVFATAIIAGDNTGTTPILLYCSSLPDPNGTYTVRANSGSPTGTVQGMTSAGVQVTFTNGMGTLQLGTQNITTALRTVVFSIYGGPTSIPVANAYTGSLPVYRVNTAANYIGGVSITTLEHGEGYYYAGSDPITLEASVSSSTPALMPEDSYTFEWYRSVDSAIGGATASDKSQLISNVVAQHGVLSSTLKVETSGYYQCLIRTKNDTNIWTYTPRVWVDIADDSTYYMPYLRSSYNQTDGAYLSLAGQEGGPHADPVTYPVAYTGDLYSTTDLNYEGGVQIPNDGSLFHMGMMMMGFFDLDGEPSSLVPEFYASGIDTVNIEFGDALPFDELTGDPLAQMTLSMNGQDLMTEPITQRVYTLRYDYRSPLTVTIRIGESVQAFVAQPFELARTVLTWGSDYFYLNNLGVGSTKGQLIGSFIHLFEDMALTADGKVIALADGRMIREKGEPGLIDPQSLYRFAYDGCTLETYRNFTRITENGSSVLREMPLVVKNGRLYSLTAEQPFVYDGVLLDHYLDQEFFALLGEDGKIGVLSGEIRHPSEFKNANILHMSNTLSSDKPYVLVRYKNGTAYGFNYLTGEKLPLTDVQGDMSLLQYVGDFFSSIFAGEMTDWSEGYRQIQPLQHQLTVRPIDPDGYHPGKSDGEKNPGDKTGVTGEKTDGETGIKTGVTGGKTGITGEKSDNVADDAAGDIMDGTDEAIDLFAESDSEANALPDENAAAEGAPGEDAASVQANEDTSGEQSTGAAASEKPTVDKAGASVAKQTRYLIAFNSEKGAYEVLDAQELLRPDEANPPGISVEEAAVAYPDLPMNQANLGVGAQAKTAPVSAPVILIFLVITVAVTRLLYVIFIKLRENQ